MSNTVIHSGGIDSTTVLAMAIETGMPTRSMSMYYGQTHRREVEAAALIAEHYGIEHEVINAHGLLHGSALLGAAPLPEGAYDDPSMASTVVQGRNMLFVSLAVADCAPGSMVWVGVHAGDHPVYADCRPEFWSSLGQATAAAYGVLLSVPLIHHTKTDVVALAAKLGAPLDLTWSCYAGGERHCGRCGTCVERAEAFATAGVPDPTEYEDANFWRTAVAR